MSSETTIEPTQWEVRPAGIEDTKFGDPESFYLTVRRINYNGEQSFVVGRNHDTHTGFTMSGKQVFLRHDVNAKHARHETLAAAFTLARDIASGDVQTVNYQTWRTAEARHFPEPQAVGDKR